MPVAGYSALRSPKNSASSPHDAGCDQCARGISRLARQAAERCEHRFDVTEDTVREIALPLGFVDIKVCAVSEVWSGLKLVIRKSERGS